MEATTLIILMTPTSTAIWSTMLLLIASRHSVMVSTATVINNVLQIVTALIIKLVHYTVIMVTLQLLLLMLNLT